MREHLTTCRLCVVVISFFVDARDSFTTSDRQQSHQLKVKPSPSLGHSELSKSRAPTLPVCTDVTGAVTSPVNFQASHVILSSTFKICQDAGLLMLEKVHNDLYSLFRTDTDPDYQKTDIWE